MEEQQLLAFNRWKSVTWLGQNYFLSVYIKKLRGGEKYKKVVKAVLLSAQKIAKR